MSTTDELRHMLDERGVKYRTHGTTDRTWFEVGNISWFIIERENGSLTADAVFLTPEQAIAATLGEEDTYTREDVESAFVSGYSLGLDMFDSSKQEKGWNQNERNLDEEMEDLGWVRKDAVMLGTETCRRVFIDDWLWKCSECGSRHGSGHLYNFCPNCGRKVVDE